MKLFSLLIVLHLGLAHAEENCGDLLKTNIEQEMRQAVLQYGRSAFSFDVFESPEKYRWFPFQGAHGSGGIAYREAYQTRVIVGDPLLAPADWTDGVKAFLAARRPLSATMATFASQEFSDIATATNGAAIEAQAAVSVNPQAWNISGPKRSQIRTCVRKAEREGLKLITMTNLKEPEPWFREKAETLVADWRVNSLKRNGNVHDVNLWDASEYKRYFAMFDPKTGEFQAMVVARPLAGRSGLYLWTARASNCLNGSLEATIAGAIQSLRDEGFNYVTFGPFQSARPHSYVDGSGGTWLGRFCLRNLVPAYIKYAGYDQTMNYFKKFDFDTSETIYNLIWPRKTWIRPYSALNKLFGPKRN